MLSWINKDPEKFAVSSGIYADENGNIFEVYIRADTKGKVRDFIKNNLDTGKLKLGSEIVSIDDREDTVSKPAEQSIEEVQDEERPTSKMVVFPSSDIANLIKDVSIDMIPYQVDVPENTAVLCNISSAQESVLVNLFEGVGDLIGGSAQPPRTFSRMVAVSTTPNQYQIDLNTKESKIFLRKNAKRLSSQLTLRSGKWRISSFKFDTNKQYYVRLEQKTIDPSTIPLSSRSETFATDWLVLVEDLNYGSSGTLQFFPG